MRIWLRFRHILLRKRTCDGIIDRFRIRVLAWRHFLLVARAEALNAFCDLRLSVVSKGNWWLGGMEREWERLSKCQEVGDPDARGNHHTRSHRARRQVLQSGQRSKRELFDKPRVITRHFSLRRLNPPTHYTEITHIDHTLFIGKKLLQVSLTEKPHGCASPKRRVG